jgi:hypothetical protein
MATENIETLSDSKIWVLACSENEKCEIESLCGNVSFIESTSEPITQIENNNMWFIERVPRSFIGNGTSKLWVFIDNKSKLRKRELTGGGVFTPVTGGVYDSAMERNVTATAISGGNVIYSRTVTASSSVGQRSNSATASTTLVSKLPFGIGINGDTPIPIAARVTNIGSASTDIYYHFEWKEIR